MNVFEVGDIVQQNQKGTWRKGRVVEVGPEEVTSKFYGRDRVLWFHPNGTPDKRTWVATKTLVHERQYITQHGSAQEAVDSCFGTIDGRPGCVQNGGGRSNR